MKLSLTILCCLFLDSLYVPGLKRMGSRGGALEVYPVSSFLPTFRWFFTSSGSLCVPRNLDRVSDVMYAGPWEKKERETRIEAKERRNKDRKNEERIEDRKIERG